jgi:putative transposase
MVSFKGVHFVKDIPLTCVRWYVAYPLSYRHVEELMQERGVSGRPRDDQPLGREI